MNGEVDAVDVMSRHEMNSGWLTKHGGPQASPEQSPHPILYGMAARLHAV
jgi:hypothetical protein